MHLGQRYTFNIGPNVRPRRRRAIQLVPLLAAAWALLASGAAVAESPAKPKGFEPLKRAAAAPAKPKRVEPPKPATVPMRVVIVRDSRPGCEPNCAEWIGAVGQITADTPAQFRRAFKALGPRKLPIFISSPGGSVPAAIAIGREIRKRGLDVAVERTILQACEQPGAACDLRALKDGDKARPEPIGAQCSSACVLILAAGTERVVPTYGFVGVHAHFATQTIRSVMRTYQVQRRFENGRFVEQRRLLAEKQLSSRTEEREPDYAPVQAYFNDMGITSAVMMPLIRSTPHKSIHRMTPLERGWTRLVTRVAAGDTLLPTAAPPAEANADAPKPVAVSVAAELLAYYPPGGNTVDIFVRLRPSDVPLRTASFTGEIAFADGSKLIARGTGGAPSDPLYAALALEQFCTLRRAGDLSIKVAVDITPSTSMPLRITGDLAKAGGAAEFGARYCDSRPNS